MKSVQMVKSSDVLCSVVDELQHHSHLGIDTESDGFYRYFEKTCLIQISTPERDIIIDPLAIDDMSPLKEVFETPRIEKILHASNNDLLALQRDYGFRVRNLFDTAVAWQLLGHKRCGLAYILRKEFQVEHSKKSKYQRCDWAKRPLEPDQVEYAQLDTHYLISLRHRFDRQLCTRRLREKAEEKFRELEDLTYEPKKPNPHAYMKIKGAREMNSQGRRILKALYLFRDGLAQRQDLSSFRIISNESMLRLATSNPQTPRDLLHIQGIPKRFKGRGAESVLTVIKRANRQVRTE